MVTKSSVMICDVNQYMYLNEYVKQLQLYAYKSQSCKVLYALLFIIQRFVQNNFFFRYVRKRINHWCFVEPKNPNPRVHCSSGKLDKALGWDFPVPTGHQ